MVQKHVLCSRHDGVEDFYILTMLVILLNFMVESGHGSFENFLTTGNLQAGRKSTLTTAGNEVNFHIPTC